MPICASISAGFVISCSAPLIPGTEDDLLLANKADIETITVDNTNPMLVTSIVMKDGKQFFKYEGQNMSTEPKDRIVLTRYSRFYEHEVRFKLFGADAAAKLQAYKISQGELVSLHKLKSGTWELSGKNIGLKVAEMEHDPNSTDTGGAYDILLKTPDTSAKEPFLPATFYVTSPAATETAIGVLLAPAV